MKVKARKEKIIKEIVSLFADIGENKEETLKALEAIDEITVSYIDLLREEIETN